MGKKPAGSFGARTRETVGRRSYEIFRLDALEKRGVGAVSRLPLSLKVAPRLANLCLDEGLISRALMQANAVSFSPPLVISESECDEIVARFTRALGKLTDQLVKEGSWKEA